MMAAIHQYGHIWKDTHPGVWSTPIEIFGKVLFAYAVEVERDEDGRLRPTATDEAEDHWRRYQQVTNYHPDPDVIDLADMKVVVYII